VMAIEARIVDFDDNEVPVGEIGEIVARGEAVMTGYWNRPEETAEALRGGWMHTGDVGRMDADGYIHIVDRVKDMIITGGENVYSAEVENAVGRHPAVASCAVIGIPSERWGEAVHAVIVLKPGHSASADEIIAHCKTLIANYKCPRSVDFVAGPAALGCGQGAQDHPARALLAGPQPQRGLIRPRPRRDHHRWHHPTGGRRSPSVARYAEARRS